MNNQIALSKLIGSIESEYLKMTMDFVTMIFRAQHLPSHDAVHHLRVWKFAKQYLLMKENQDKVNKDILTGIFFSCFFHDTGMSVTLDKNHGRESRRIFEEFSGNVLKTQLPLHDEIAKAIEMHDEKEAIAMQTAGYKRPSDILRILTICDDLDAYGAIGVLRYTEIYLIRDIPEQEIPAKVVENVKFRADFFGNSTVGLPLFREIHEPRIRFIRDFFNKAQIYGSKEYSLIHAVKSHVIDAKSDYHSLVKELEKSHDLREYAQSLKKELET